MTSKIILLDTNFLLLPFQFKIHIIREIDYLVDVNHEYVISSETLSELQGLGGSVGKSSMAARLALKMIGASKIKVVESDRNKTVDDWIVEFAKAHPNNIIVCTNDSELRRRLRSLKVKMITLKAKAKVGFV